MRDYLHLTYAETSAMSTHNVLSISGPVTTSMISRTFLPSGLGTKRTCKVRVNTEDVKNLQKAPGTNHSRTSKEAALGEIAQLVVVRPLRQP